MLISFAIQNWMSFRDPAEFSLIASREQQHGRRLTRLNKFRMRALPIAAVYGGNASGKTNLFKALAFAKHFIVRGCQQDAMIPIETFELDKDFRSKPASFTFEILVNDDIYEFSFAVTASEVVEEKLIKILSTSEKVLYHRIMHDLNPRFHSSVRNQRLKFAFEGTRDNQLFLTNSVSQKIDTFKHIYDWFAKTLILVAPDARFNAFEKFISEDSPLYNRMNLILPKLDTGITTLGGEEVSFDTLQIPDILKQELREKTTDKTTIKLNERDEKLVVSRENGKLVVKKLYTYHQDAQGNKVRFEMKQESDGSKRIMDLLPAFLDLTANQSSSVYIIDELDRSLHTLLTKQLISIYLGNCSSSTRNQMIFTTHDLMLMNQSLLRRDEMWITKRKNDGSSQLISFAEFDDIRNDKDIRKSYLQGRMGGIPDLTADIIISDIARGLHSNGTEKI